VLGVPLGARSAHVVELGAIGIEQGAGERLEDVGDIHAKELVRMASPGACSGHRVLRVSGATMTPARIVPMSCRCRADVVCGRLGIVCIAGASGEVPNFRRAEEASGCAARFC